MKHRKPNFPVLLLTAVTAISFLTQPAAAFQRSDRSPEAVEVVSQTVIGFAPFDPVCHALEVSADRLPAVEELTRRMPQTLEVLLEDGSAAFLPVQWSCPEYGTAEDYFFLFTPTWNEAAFPLAKELNRWEALPYVGVFLREEVSGIQPLSYCNAKYAKYEEQTFEFLVTKLAMNPAQACGVMANIYNECGFIPNNLQRTYETKLGFTDASYTAAVDKGTYTGFATDRAGYGLCQWTDPVRKKALLDFVRSMGASIGDAGAQLLYLKKELSANNDKVLYNGKTIYNAMLKFKNSAKGAYDAGYYWVKNYEVCSEYPGKDKTTSEYVKRARLARDFYWPIYSQYLMKPVILKDVVYDGTPQKPEVHPTYEYYEIKYFDNVNVGSAYAIAYALDANGEPVLRTNGDYLYQRFNFNILPRSLKLATGSLNKTSYSYSGNACKPSFSVMDIIDGGAVKLVKNTDYTLKYTNNKEVGTATATVTGMGNYTGSISLTYKIKPAAPTLTGASSKKSGQLTVEWDAVGCADGYQIDIAADSDFTDEYTRKTLRDPSIISYTFTQLKSSTRYYIRIRTFTKVNDVNYYSGWQVYDSTVSIKQNQGSEEDAIPFRSYFSLPFFIQMCYAFFTSCK